MGIRAKLRPASRRIALTSGVFSGVKIVGILCSLVRNKLIAWLIGPAGMGLVVLFNSILELIGQTTRMSVDQSAQRDISQSSGDTVAETVTVVRRWALWLGLLGMAVTCALSPLLSYWSFETISHWPVFCLLSIVPLCIAYNGCTTAQNQGLRRYRAAAMTSVTASLAGLLMAVPLIVWLRIDSIPWVIVAYGVSAWLGALLFRPRLRSVKMPMTQVVNRGKSFVRLGVQITLAMFVTQALNYFFVVFLNTFASLSFLGIYQSGYTLMNSYVGIVFSALWIEYYPRLSAIAHSPMRLNVAVRHELRMCLTALTPLVCVLILLAAPIVRLIYSADFLAVIPYIALGGAGVILRASSWCLAYVMLARGDGRIYLITEIVSGIVGLALNIAGYLSGGFFGLGIAFILWYLLYTILTAVVCRRRYGVKYDGVTWRYTAAALVLTLAVAAIRLYVID